MLEIIAGVDNNGQIAGDEQLGKPIDQFCTTNTTSQGHNFHMYLVISGKEFLSGISGISAGYPRKSIP